MISNIFIGNIKILIIVDDSKKILLKIITDKIKAVNDITEGKLRALTSSN